MFTRTEAVDFALERGLKGANFVYYAGGMLVVYYWIGDSTNLRYSSGPSAIPMESGLVDVLRRRGSGWFVSAKVNKAWSWYFDNGDVVPHDE